MTALHAKWVIKLELIPPRFTVILGSHVLVFAGPLKYINPLYVSPCLFAMLRLQLIGIDSSSPYFGGCLIFVTFRVLHRISDAMLPSLHINSLKVF